MARVTWYPYGNSRLQIVNTRPSPFMGERTDVTGSVEDVFSDLMGTLRGSWESPW